MRGAQLGSEELWLEVAAAVKNTVPPQVAEVRFAWEEESDDDYLKKRRLSRSLLPKPKRRPLRKGIITKTAAIAGAAEAGGATYSRIQSAASPYPP